MVAPVAVQSVGERFCAGDSSRAIVTGTLNACSTALRTVDEVVAQALSPAIAAIGEHADVCSNANLSPWQKSAGCPTCFAHCRFRVGGAGGFACDSPDWRACLH